MPNFGTWHVIDEIRFIESGYLKTGDAFLKKYRQALKRRFFGFSGGRMHSHDRQILILFCRVAGECGSEKFIRAHCDGGKRCEGCCDDDQRPMKERR